MRCLGQLPTVWFQVWERKCSAQRPLTREQLALILYHYAQVAGYAPHQGGMAIQEFSDSASISGWALEAVQWAVNAGLISGTGDGMLDPDGAATRAQVAQIFMNFCQDNAIE